MIDEIAKMNTGRRVSLALEVLGPEIDLVRKDCIARMKQMYRADAATEVKLLAAVGELVAMDNLEIKLRQKIRSGETAQRKLSDE